VPNPEVEDAIFQTTRLPMPSKTRPASLISGIIYNMEEVDPLALVCLSNLVGCHGAPRRITSLCYIASEEISNLDSIVFRDVFTVSAHQTST
jgi:hypothetical protein